jgi:uncharacterized protein
VPEQHVPEESAPDLLPALAGFTRVLRSAGLPISADRTAGYLRAVAEVGAGDRAGVYWAGRSTLCGDPDHLRLYDLAFEQWFGGAVARPRPGGPARPPAEVATMAALAPDGVGPAADQPDQDPLRVAASAAEVLRHRDVAELDQAGREQVRALMATLPVGVPARRSARRRPAPRGALDVRRTLREELRRAGEPGPLRHHRAGHRPRPVVWLVDVSGSMAPYADLLLRLAHAQSRAGTSRAGGPGGGRRRGRLSGRSRVEVFTVGTRLTRVTAAFGHRDVERALRAAGEQVPDWSGGTRLGETVQAFVDRWGRRGLARGAVVVICSDGWERGDPGLLGEQVARLARLAHRLVWVNPHRGKPGYRPVQGGMAAVLPFVDDFVAGHSVASYHRLMQVLADA